MNKFIAYSILALGITAHGQMVTTEVASNQLIEAPLPDAPEQMMVKSVTVHPPLKPHETRADYALWSAIASEHLANFVLDEQCFKKPYQQCHEGILPGFVWKNPPVLLTTHIFFSAAQITISHELIKHNHRKIARTWDITNLVAFGGVDVYVHHLVNTPVAQPPKR